MDALPFLQAPVDTLREGAGVNLKHAGLDTHEVQVRELPTRWAQQPGQGCAFRRETPCWHEPGVD